VVKLRVNGGCRLQVNLNVVVVGSKALGSAEIESLPLPESILVRISDGADSARILFEGPAEFRRFSTGSVGYGLQVREASFA